MKKREVLPSIQAVIDKLVEMSVDGAEIEIKDNDDASMRLRRAFLELKNNEFRALDICIQDCRRDVLREREKLKKAKREEFIYKKQQES